MNTTSTTQAHRPDPRPGVLRIALLCLLTVTVAVALGAGRARAAQSASASGPVVDVFSQPVESGGIVDVYGYDFQPGELVDVEFGGWTIASVVAESDGSFATWGVVDPLMPAGTHPLDANGDLGSWASTDLTVVDPPAPPAVTQRYPYVGPLQLTVVPGGPVDVIGGDFLPGEIVTIEFGGSVLDVVTADANGEFVASGWIDPGMPAGFHPLDAWGDLGSSAWADLEVAPGPTATPTLLSVGPAEQGGVAVVEGVDFLPYETVWIEYGGQSLPVAADGWGWFVVTVPVASDMPPGAHPLDAWGDGGSSATIDQVVVARAVSHTPTSPTTTPPTPTSDDAPVVDRSNAGRENPAEPRSGERASIEPAGEAIPTTSPTSSPSTSEHTQVATSAPTTAESDRTAAGRSRTGQDGSGSSAESSDDDASDAQDAVGTAGAASATDAGASTPVHDSDSGVAPLGIAGLALAGASAGAGVAMAVRRRR